ncbi:MAG: hypothetical protein ACKO1N_12990 [Erythrobacter sp.]
MTSTAAPKSTFRFHPKLWIAAAMLLAFPAAAMLMSDKITWTAEVLAASAVLLTLLCVGLEIAWNRLDAFRWRVGGALLLALLFVTVWAHLAVELFS